MSTTAHHPHAAVPAAESGLQHCSSAELDQRARRAELGMDQALRLRRWALVTQYRAQRHAVQAEWHRRRFGPSSQAG